MSTYSRKSSIKKHSAKFIYHFIYADLIYFEEILMTKKTKQRQRRVEGFC